MTFWVGNLFSYDSDPARVILKTEHVRKPDMLIASKGESNITKEGYNPTAFLKGNRHS